MVNANQLIQFHFAYDLIKNQSEANKEQTAALGHRSWGLSLTYNRKNQIKNQSGLK